MSTDRKGGGNRKKKPDTDISLTSSPDLVPESLSELISAQESIPAMVNDKNTGIPEEENPGPKAKVRKFPAKPGVYLMKDAQGRVVYVGKAKNLRARAEAISKKHRKLIREFATGLARWWISTFSKQTQR